MSFSSPSETFGPIGPGGFVPVKIGSGDNATHVSLKPLPPINHSHTSKALALRHMLDTLAQQVESHSFNELSSVTSGMVPIVTQITNRLALQATDKIRQALFNPELSSMTALRFVNSHGNHE